MRSIQGCSPKKEVGGRKKVHILSENFLMTFFSHRPQIMLFMNPNFTNDHFKPYRLNFLLFIPVNKYGLCYICVKSIWRTRKVHGGRVHPVKNSMWTPSTFVHARLHPWKHFQNVLISISETYSFNSYVLMPSCNRS